MPITTVLKRLPWQALFQGTYLFRRYVFAKKPEEVDYMVVDGATSDELQRLFFTQGLVKGDYASYYYYGEDLNMVNGMYRDDEYEWYQYHVRGFETDVGIELRPHTELYWRLYPRKHIKLVNLDVEEGIEMTKQLLDETGFEYDVVSV